MSEKGKENKGKKKPIPTRFPPKLLTAIDKKVEEGYYNSRSDAIRDLLWKGLGKPMEAQAL